MKRLNSYLRSLAFLSLTFVTLCLSSCDNDEPKFNVVEDDLFYYEYANYDGYNSSLWMIYHYQDANIVPANTNSFQTTNASVIGDNSIYVEVAKDAPNPYLIANKLPIKYSDYGKFELTSDKKHVYNGLYECTHKDGQAGKFIIALNSKTGTATIYLFKNKEVIRKPYSTRLDANNNPELVISSLNMGMGEENWIISNNVIATDYHQTGVYTISITAGESTFTYINSLLVIDDKR